MIRTLYKQQHEMGISVGHVTERNKENICFSAF